MNDREKVIKGLQCCCTSFPSLKSCPVCPYEKECFHDAACLALLSDALVLLKKQEDETADKIVAEDASIPEQFLQMTSYDPADDVVACTSCLICGTDIPLRRYESGPRICSKCKEAVIAIKKV